MTIEKICKELNVGLRTLHRYVDVYAYRPELLIKEKPINTEKIIDLLTNSKLSIAEIAASQGVPAHLIYRRFAVAEYRRRWDKSKK